MAKSNSIITVTPDAEGKALAFMVNVGTDEHPQHVHMTLDLARSTQRRAMTAADSCSER